MSRNQTAQAVAPARQQSARPLDAADRLQQRGRFVGIKQLTIDLDFVTTAPGNPEDACRTWLRRHGIVSLRRGRTILIDWRDVERVLRGR
jgi:hypothetical protein